MTGPSPIVLPSGGDWARTIDVLSAGGIVIIPTDTFYGLAVNPMHPGAVERLFRLKGRDRNKPLILLAPDLETALKLTADASDGDREFARRLWPGPVTLIFKAGDRIPRSIRGGGDSVGLRVPNRPATLEILKAWGGPLTAPSANRQGQPAPERVEVIDPGLFHRVDLAIDDGPLPGGSPSTLVDLTVRPLKVLRVGAVPETRIRELAGELARPESG